MTYRTHGSNGAGWISCLALCLVLASPAPAGADRVSRLVSVMKRARDYKVRLRAVQVMGQLRSWRAVPSLVRALDDPTPVVRGMAAVALSRIGDLSAARPLSTRLAREKNPQVKVRLSQAIKALALLSRPSAARYFISLGKLRNRSSVSSTDMPLVLEDALHREFGKVPRITTRWGTGQPTRPALKRHGVQGYILDATVTGAGAKQQDREVMVFARVQYTLSPMSGKSPRVTFQGNAQLMMPLARYRKRYLAPYITDLMEVSAAVAQENIVRHQLPAK